MRRLLLLAVVLTVFGCGSDDHQRTSSITIATAANFTPALREAAEIFTRQHQIDTKIISGSSGNLFAQIRAGAPYDLFFSADEHYPQLLYEQGETSFAPKVYAIGQLVLWWRADLGLDAADGMKVLEDERIVKIAIANPAHAPYGKRTQESLRHYGLWEKLKDKLVYGKNVMQTAQFAENGDAQVAIISFSLALAPELYKIGQFYRIDADCHAPLRQSYTALEEKPAVREFIAFTKTGKFKEVLRRHGYKIDLED